jgi:sec-independent protein translocase protein TatC
LSQIWAFVAPGLYRHEKKAFMPFLFATPILFTMGGALVYYFVIPLAWRFLLGFEQPAIDGGMPIQLEAKVGEYLSLVMKLIFAFGISFELPVLLTLMARVGMVSSEGLKEKRRYAVVMIFVAAAVLTPPDVISQIGLAIPLMILYEISIISCRMVEKKRKEMENGDDDGAIEETDFNTK